MMRATYERASEIFQHALSLRADEQIDYIESACNGDAELVAVVRKLIDSDKKEGFLDCSADISGMVSCDHHKKADQLISLGDYRVLEIIASGSMGIVFLAEQASPKRRVAIKLLPIDHALKSSLLTEAALLGRLQHPGVARIYEAGTSIALYKDGIESRVAFIAMEYIEGKTLSVFADKRKFHRIEAAELLLEITLAIEHAHRRGVIHRDLKPSNILIDTMGNPHIIDFGVGLLRESVDEQRDAHIAGTTAYMAPEQMVGQIEEVDTRADVFSIGVIGYELLLGRKLFQPTSSIDEALLERVKNSEQDINVELRRYSGRDLARVITRAIASDKNQRHPSASALAEELRCVIEGRPVDGPDASSFRLIWMFARRHRFVACLLLVAFFVCIAATVGLGISLSRANIEASRADAAAVEMHAKANSAERIAEFLKTSFLGVDPEERGVAVTLFEAIDYAADRIHRDLADVPDVEADVRSAIGFVYRRQGRLEDAFEQTRIAHRLYTNVYGADDERTEAAAEELAYLTWMYEGDADSARQSIKQIITKRNSQANKSLSSDGWIHMKAGAIALAVDDLVVAEKHFLEAESLLVETYGKVYAARSLRQRALVRLYAGQYQEAEEMARSAFDLCFGVAEQEYIAARCLVTLGEVFTAQGKHQEALIELDHATTLLKKLTGESGPDMAKLNLISARAEYELGHSENAVHKVRSAIIALESTVSSSHPDLSEARAYLNIYESKNDTELRDQLNAIHNVFDGSHGPDHRLSIASLHAAYSLAVSLGDDHASRRLQETISALEKRREARVGPVLHRSHPKLLIQYQD